MPNGRLAKNSTMRLPNDYHLAKIIEIRESRSFMFVRLVQKPVRVIVHASDFCRLTAVDDRLEGEKIVCRSTPVIQEEPEVVVWLSGRMSSGRANAAEWAFMADLDAARKMISPTAFAAARQAVPAIDEKTLVIDDSARISRLSSRGRGFPMIRAFA